MTAPSTATATFACSGCGAPLRFEPGVDSLTCPHCGTSTPVPKVLGGTEELDFHEFLARLSSEADTYEVLAARCAACGAETTLPPNVVGDQCPFCTGNLIPAAQSTRLIRPRSVLPFRIARKEAEDAMHRWMKGLWFAPNDFVRSARREGGMAGLYVPCWTYDCSTTSRYTGQRGEAYYVTERYTAQENGKRVTRTRQVRKIRWYPAAGVVQKSFDDVLVLASESLPKKEAASLEPWDLENLVAYSEEYLTGFRTESYRVPLDRGFEAATRIMDDAIRAAIRHDIGGDEQQIHSVDTRYDDITFKHVLLPVWISPYRYRDRVYRSLVNARTGEVQGERPYSAIKIALLVILLLLLALLIFFFADAGSEGTSEPIAVALELLSGDSPPGGSAPKAE